MNSASEGKQRDAVEVVFVLLCVLVLNTLFSCCAVS